MVPPKKVKPLPKQRCRKCGYSWVPKKKDPKLCPRCKCRLDWPPRSD